MERRDDQHTGCLKPSQAEAWAHSWEPSEKLENEMRPSVDGAYRTVCVWAETVEEIVYALDAFETERAQLPTPFAFLVNAPAVSENADENKRAAVRCASRGGKNMQTWGGKVDINQ